MRAWRAWRQTAGVMDKRCQQDGAESQRRPWAAATVPRKREGTGRVAELSERARTDQALIHPTERLGDVAACGKREGACVPPGCLLWDAVPHPEYRAPMVAAGGRSWRCPLGTSAR